jgi:hypothetical protein
MATKTRSRYIYSRKTSIVGWVVIGLVGTAAVASIIVASILLIVGSTTSSSSDKIVKIPTPKVSVLANGTNVTLFKNGLIRVCDHGDAIYYAGTEIEGNSAYGSKSMTSIKHSDACATPLGNNP